MTCIFVRYMHIYTYIYNEYKTNNNFFGSKFLCLFLYMNIYIYIHILHIYFVINFEKNII